MMIAYDGGEAANKTVDMVTTSPMYKGLICNLVCASRNDSTNSLLEEEFGYLKATGGIESIGGNLQEKLEHAFCEYQVSHDIDLTIMGAFSHTHIHDLLWGNFTVKMLLHTNTPLLLLR